MSAFVRDQWYIAAYGHEVGRDLLARTIVGEPIVLPGRPAPLPVPEFR